MEAVDILARWGHYLFGITWIGLLYYFNFVQGAYMAAASDAAKVDVFSKLVPRAMLWFRYGALLTFLTGALLLVSLLRGWQGEWTWALLPIDIIVASAMATLMFLNVWLIIWPNQSIVIKSNQSVLDGGDADPDAAGAAGKALLASRTNTLLSGPMLFLMMTSAHFVMGPAGNPHSHGGAPEHVHTSYTSLIVCLIIVALIELNGIWGRTGPLLTKVPAVIGSSVVLTVVLALLVSQL